MHAGVLRPLMWLRVGKDGSIYVGLLLGQPTYGTKGHQAASRTTKVLYSNAKPLAPEDLRKGSRVSFKASGEIHLGARVINGTSLENLSNPKQLCLALFIHPSRYKPPRKPAENEYDVSLDGYPVDDSCPMYASIAVAPWKGAEVQPPRGLASIKVWSSFAFGFAGLERTPDYSLGVVIGHGIVGSWPQLPHVALTAPTPRGV